MKKKFLLGLIALGFLVIQSTAETKILKQEELYLGDDKYILYTICKDDFVYSMYKHIRTGNLVVNQEFKGYGSAIPLICSYIKSSK